MNPEMMGEFVKGGGAKPVRAKKPKGLQRGKGLNQKSTKQEARDNGWLRAIVYGKLILQEMAYARDQGPPPYYCEGCGWRASDDIIEALQILRPCHRAPRKEGQGVRFHSTGKIKQIGLDEWDNIYPGCDTCNLKDHLGDRSEPRFTGDSPHTETHPRP